MIIDFQHHYTPPELQKAGPDAVSVRLDEDGNPAYLQNPLLSDLPAHVGMMDRAGIDAAVKDFPGRFIGLAHVPALKPAEAAAELRRCGDLGFPGVAIGSELQDQ